MAAMSKAQCPVCKKMTAVRNGKFVYHKWLLPGGIGRFVPCSGIGRKAS